MANFSISSIALKWHFFTYLSTTYFYGEYFNLFMKQLGFNPAQIGFTTLLGVPNLLAPLYLLLGEKFRARKTVLVIVAVALSVCCMLPLLSLIVPALEPKCYSKHSIDSLDATQQALLRNTRVHLDYANNTYNLKRSAVIPKNIIHLSRSYVATPFSREPLRPNNGSSSKDQATKQPSAPRNQHFLQFLATHISKQKNTSSHSNNAKNSTYFAHLCHSQPWLSALFLILIFSRSQLVMLESVDMALTNVATMTYLKEEKANYGAYLMWGHVGTAVSMCCIAGLAWLIKIPICGVEEYGYFVAFIWGLVNTLFSSLSLPWFKFEYNEKKSFSWSGVKSVVFNARYFFIFVIVFCTGLCVSFQVSWEFWYLDGLSASPLLLGGAALIRRPLVALSTLSSTYLMKKIGDLNTICVAFFLFSSSFLALSFTRIAWLVLVIDTFQASAYGIGYSAFTVLFYKASSTENSGIILGLVGTIFSIGYESGVTLMGALFHALGTQVTLLLYSTSCAALLVILLLYICFSKSDQRGYQKLPQISDD